MNEQRKPVETWVRRLPRKTGKENGRTITLKIELFPLYLWSQHWEPGSNLFSPKLPLQSEGRKLAWDGLFRIRVDGVWVGGRSKKAKYFGYTKEMIIERYFIG